jgi:hypothetical protein
MNRKQRRVLAKKVPSDGLHKASTQIATALEAIEGLGGPAMFEGLSQKIEEVRTLLGEMSRTVASLDFELGLQREVNLRLLSKLYANAELPARKALVQLKTLEDQIRKDLEASLEET